MDATKYREQKDRTLALQMGKDLDEAADDERSLLNQILLELRAIRIASELAGGYSPGELLGESVESATAV